MTNDIANVYRVVHELHYLGKFESTKSALIQAMTTPPILHEWPHIEQLDSAVPLLVGVSIALTW